MGENTKESGSTITWKAMDFTLGMMVEPSKGNTKMIKSMAMVFIVGTMGENTRETGSLANSMDWESM